MEVIEGRLDTIITFQAALYEAGERGGVVKSGPRNLSLFTSPYIVQHAIASEPDAVVVVSAHNFNYASAKTLRLAGLKTAVLLTETPYFLDFERQMASVYDVAFSHERRAKDYLDHPSLHYLPHAYHPAIHSPALPPDPALACDVFFCGSLFDERARLFRGVDWTGIHFRTRGYRLDTGELDLMDNMAVARGYRSAKINLNHHRTTTNHGSGEHIAPEMAESLGPRAYEIAACGGFQLMDDSRPERHDVFGEVCPTYRAGDTDDLTRQIRHWLARPDERARVAAAMHQAVLPHSWTDRARRMLEVLCC